MARANVEKFYAILDADEGLCSALFDGIDTMDQLAQRAVEMAGARGIAFGKDDVVSFIEEQTAIKSDGELSDMQLESVAGGKGSSKEPTMDRSEKPLKAFLNWYKDAAAYEANEVASRVKKLFD